MNSLKLHLPPNSESTFTEDSETVKSALWEYSADIRSSDLVRISNSMEALSKDDAHWLEAVRETLGATSLLDSVNDASSVNQEFLVRLARSSYASTHIPGIHSENLSARVRSLPWVAAREWGSEQDLDPEREAVYSSIINVLRSNLTSGKILVPGSSCSRLQYEISLAGYETTGVEIDYLRLLVSDFIFSGNSCTLTPYILETCNRVNPADNTRPVHVPDIHIHREVLSRMIIIGEEFLTASSRMPESQFDGIVTSFFLDTTSNVHEYVSAFSKLLKDGGIWINCGPLQFQYPCERSAPSSGQFLSLEDLKKLIRGKGFTFVEEKFVRTEYMGNPISLMSSKLDCVFFVAKLAK